MTLTPLLKLIVIAWALLSSMFVLAWTGIQGDLLAIGLNEHVYAIVLTVAVIVDKAAVALLGYLGLKAPTVEDSPPSAI